MSRRQILARIGIVAALLLMVAGSTLRARAKGDGPRMAVDPLTGHLFVIGATVDADNTVSMLDPATGRILRTITLGNPFGVIPYAMAVDAHTGRLFVIVTSGPSGTFAVLDTRTGAVLHTGPAIASPQAVAVDEGINRAYVVSSMATVHVLDARTGAVLDTGRTGVAVYTIAVAARAGHVFVGGAEYVGVTAMLDAHTGALLRTIGSPPHAGVGGGPMAVDERTGRVFALGDHGVDVLDAASGRVMRTVAVGPPPGTIVADERAGHVFVSSGDGIAMLDARSGTVLRTLAPKHIFAPLVIDETTGRAFVADSYNTIWVFDTRTGRTLRTVPTTPGADYPWLAVDERHSRVFVEIAGSVRVLDALTGAVRRTILVRAAAG